MLVSFFTAMSWFRSWASYFSGYNAALRPEHISCDESKAAGENGLHERTVGARTNREQGTSEALTPPALWKSMMARAKAATWPGLGIRVPEGRRQRAGERHGR